MSRSVVLKQRVDFRVIQAPTSSRCLSNPRGEARRNLTVNSPRESLIPVTVDSLAGTEVSSFKQGVVQWNVRCEWRMPHLSMTILRRSCNGICGTATRKAWQQVYRSSKTKSRALAVVVTREIGMSKVMEGCLGCHRTSCMWTSTDSEGPAIPCGSRHPRESLEADASPASAMPLRPASNKY